MNLVTSETRDQSQMVPVRVMVVEDFEPFRVLIASCLKPPAFQVICETSDGLYAVQKAEELRPDLVIMDIGLETLNGIYAARRIRAAAGNSRILFFSAHSDPEVVRDALDAGATGFVDKADADELLAAVDAVLQGRRYLSRSVKGSDDWFRTS